MERVRHILVSVLSSVSISASCKPKAVQKKTEGQNSFTVFALRKGQAFCLTRLVLLCWGFLTSKHTPQVYMREAEKTQTCQN